MPPSGSGLYVTPITAGSNPNSGQVVVTLPDNSGIPLFTITPQIDVILAPSAPSIAPAIAPAITIAPDFTTTSTIAPAFTPVTTMAPAPIIAPVIAPASTVAPVTFSMSAPLVIQQTPEKVNEKIPLSENRPLLPKPEQLAPNSNLLTFATARNSEELGAEESSTSNYSPPKPKNVAPSPAKETEKTSKKLGSKKDKESEEKPEEAALRKQHEALEICMNARENLSGDKFEQFCKIVVNDAFSNKRKFTELHTICEGQMELQEMLLDLLSAGEALELGTDLYQQFCVRDATKKFFRKVKSLYASQPSIYTKILKDFQSILGNPQVKNEEILSLGQKYFKNHQAVLDEFSTFVSGLPYPESLLPEPEIVDLSDEEDEDHSKTVYEEKINLLDAGEDDLGGDNCPCACHSSTGTQHCTHCSLKFVNGKVFSRDGKTLRPVKIEYPSSDSGRGKKRRKKSLKS